MKKIAKSAIYAIILLGCFSINVSGEEEATPKLGTNRSSNPIIQNVGQFAEEALFAMHNGSTTYWFTEEAIWLDVAHWQEEEALEPGQLGGHLSNLAAREAIKIDLGGDGQGSLEPFAPLPASVSYLIGNDPENWHRQVPVWGGVRYLNLSPGVHLVVHSQDGRFQWRLESEAGATLPDLTLSIEGAQTVEGVNERIQIMGELSQIELPLIGVEKGAAPDFLAPQIESDGLDGIWHKITAPFTTLVPEMPAAAQFLDDPSGLMYSTFLGGAGSDYVRDAVIDADRNVYLTGYTGSADFPTSTGVWDSSLSGTDAFVVKLSPNGNGSSDLAYATFLGGSGTDRGYGIALDGQDVVLVGRTTALNFPTTSGAFDTVCAPDQSGLCQYSDAFVTSLNSDGSSLTYSSYLGDSDVDEAYGLLVDAGKFIIVGKTRSADFPTTSGAYDTSCGTNGSCNKSGNSTPPSDGFLMIIDPSQSGANGLTYGTFLGGSDDDGINALDGSLTDIYLAGISYSPDLFLSGYGGGADGVVAHIKPLGGGSSDMQYGRYLAGSFYDEAEDIVFAGNLAYVTGSTVSSDYPVTNSSLLSGGSDGFLTTITIAGTIDYSAYVGGSDIEYKWSMTLDSEERIYLTAYTESIDFPTSTNPYDSSQNGAKDGFLHVMDLTLPAADKMVYSSYMGGALDEEGYEVIADDSGCAYIVGYTKSNDYPQTTGAFQTGSIAGSRDGFLSVLNMNLGNNTMLDPLIAQDGDDIDITWQLHNFNAAYHVYRTNLPYAVLGAPYKSYGPNTIEHIGVGDAAGINSYFYTVQAAACAGGGTVESAELGMFQFAIVPGS